MGSSRIHEDYLLEQAPEREEVFFDYASLGLTLRTYPLALLRPRLESRKLLTSADLDKATDRRELYTIGLVTTRQQPEIANRTVFISLEDEFGEIKVIVYRAIWERHRQEMMRSQLLAVEGRW